MKALTEQEVVKFLTQNLKYWSFEKNTIKRDFKFNTFVLAFSFMTEIAPEAEKLKHHPDWSNSYNSVSISLSSHDAHGITQLDFDLAVKIDQIYKNYL